MLLDWKVDEKEELMDKIEGLVEEMDEREFYNKNVQELEKNKVDIKAALYILKKYRERVSNLAIVGKNIIIRYLNNKIEEYRLILDDIEVWLSSEEG